MKKRAAILIVIALLGVIFSLILVCSCKDNKPKEDYLEIMMSPREDNLNKIGRKGFIFSLKSL